MERLNRQRANLADQRTQLEAEIQRASLSAKASRPELEKLQKLEVCYMIIAHGVCCRSPDCIIGGIEYTQERHRRRSEEV